MKCFKYILLLIIGFIFNVNYSLAIINPSTNPEFNIINAVTSSDISVELKSLKESVQTCGPEQPFKIIIKNNLANISKNLDGLLLKLALPNSYVLSKNVSIKINNEYVTADVFVDNSNDIYISTPFNLTGNSSIEVYFGVTITCSFLSSESITLMTYFKSSNQTFIANNNENSVAKINYTRSDYQYVEQSSVKNYVGNVESERSLRFKDYNYIFESKTKKVKLLYTHSINDIEIKKLKVKKNDGSFIEIPQNAIKNDTSIIQGGVTYNIVSIEVDAAILSLDFLPETIDLKLVFVYIGCGTTNVVYDLKQICSDGTICNFKSGAMFKESISLKSDTIPKLTFSIVPDKTRKADNCSLQGKIRYLISNNTNKIGYHFSTNFQYTSNSLSNIEKYEIYYVYNDSIGNEQFYKFNNELQTDIDGIGVGIDIVTRNDNYKFNLVQPGKSFQIEYRYELKNICLGNLNTNLIYNLDFYSLVFNMCKTSSELVYSGKLSSSESINNRKIEGPSDVIENTWTKFTYTPGYSISTDNENGLIENCSLRKYEVKFKIPGIAEVSNVKYNNVLLTTDNLKYYTESGIRYLLISHPTANEGYNGIYEVELKTNDCLTSTSQRLEFELLTYCESESCRKSLCKSTKLTYFHSDNCSTSTCFNTNSFSFKRSTLGWKVNRVIQNNMYYKEDLTEKVVENPGIDLLKAYTDDSVKVQIIGNATEKCGDYIVAKIKYLSSIDFFESKEGIFTITNATTDTLIGTIKANASQISYGVEGNYRTILYTCPLSSISSMNNVKLDFQSDIHILYNQVSISNGTKYVLEDVRGEFLFKKQNYIYGNDSWGTSFTILALLNQMNSNSSYAIDACKNKVVFGINPKSSEEQGIFDFANEFRPVTHFVNEQVITVPKDFQYVPKSAKIGITNKNDLAMFTNNDNIHYYPLGIYEIDEHYDTITHILKLNIKKSPLIANNNYDILVCAFDIKSSNCSSAVNGLNNVMINYSERDYIYLTKTSIEPNFLYIKSDTRNYQTSLPSINFNLPSSNEYIKEFKNFLKQSISLEFYNNTGRILSNFWIAFENNQSVNFSFSNVKIGQNIGSISKYGVNEKYTIVNFGNLPNIFDNVLTFDIQLDNCSTVQDKIELPFKIYMGSSCKNKQIKRPNEECQIAPIDFKIIIPNNNSELQFVSTNSNYSPFEQVSSKQICESLYYLATISNSSSSVAVYDNAATVSFPSGMELQEIAYQYGELPVKSIDYEYLNSNQIRLNLSSQIDSISNGFMIRGQINRPIRLRLKFKTNCQYSPTDNVVNLDYTFKKICGDSVRISNQDDKLKISGFENLNDVKLNIKGTNTIPISKVSSNGEVLIKIINSGNISTDESDLVLKLPKELKYVSTKKGILKNSSNELVYKIPSLSPGKVDSVVFIVNDQFGEKAREGIRPSACIEQKITMTKNLTTSCSNSCDITAILANNRICIPLPPKDTIPKEISCEDCIESFAPYQGAKYVLSAWVKEDVIQNGLTSYVGPAIVLRFKLQENDFSLSPMYGTGEIIDGWQRIYQEFTIPSDAQNISVDLINNGNNEVFFDDIRIHPFEANMKSFVYDPVSMKLVAELDENNYATFYEYDEEGALVRVKKETQKGIMTIKESRNNTIKK